MAAFLAQVFRSRAKKAQKVISLHLFACSKALILSLSYEKKNLWRKYVDPTKSWESPCLEPMIPSIILTVQSSCRKPSFIPCHAGCRKNRDFFRRQSPGKSLGFFATRVPVQYPWSSKTLDISSTIIHYHLES